MADVFLGSVYAKMELREGDLGASVNAAKRSLNGLDSSMAGSAVAGEGSAAKIGAAFGAVAGIVQSLTTKAFDALTASIGGGIKRFDTLQNYPKIMQNLGYSAEESSKSIQKMADNAKGLPVSLDALASSTKQLAPFTKDLTEATDLSSALSDAFLAAGSSAADTSRGMLQYTQMLAKGKVDMGAWSTLQETMGSSLQQVSKKLLGATGTTQGLYSKLQEGEISFHDFNQAILSLDKEGLPGLKNFRDQAFDATGGIQTTLDNLGAAFNRFWENMIKDVGAENIRTFFAQLGKSAESMGKTVGSAIRFVMPFLQKFMTFMIDHGPIVEKIILGLLAGFVGFKVIKGVGAILSPFSKALGLLGKSSKSIAPLAKGGESVGGGVGKFIASVLTPLGNPKVLLGAASVAVVGVALIAMAYAFNKIAGMQVNVKNLAIMALAVPIAAGIFALVGTFGAYAAVGAIATAIIGGGLAALAAGLSYASNEAKNIKFGELMKLSGILAVVSLIMAGISLWAGFGAVGAIASAIIGGGLMVAAMGLAKVSEYLPKINMSDIKKFAGTIAVVSGILGLVAGLAVFGAVTAVASAIIGGGLLLTAMSLVQVSKLIPKIREKDIMKFSGTLAVVSVILGIVAGFAVFGAVTTVATSIIAGGLWLTAFQLAKVSAILPNIREKDLMKFSVTLGVVSGILSAISVLGVFAAIGTIVTTVITGGVMVAAQQLLIASMYAKALKPEDLDHLTAMLKKISDWDSGGMFKNLKNMVNSTVLAATATMVRSVAEKLATTPVVPEGRVDGIKNNLKSFSELESGGIMSNLSKMISSGLLAKTAENVRDITSTLSGVKPMNTEAIDGLKANMKSLAQLETDGVLNSLKDMWASGNLQKVAENVKKIIGDLSGLKAPSEDSINKLKSVITNLSKIEISGGGFFENKGKKAEELAFIVWKIRDMANNLSGLPEVDSGRVNKFISTLNLFKNIGDDTRDGIKRLADLKDSLGNINWIKFILGDVPDDIWGKTLNLVNSIKLFDRIDDNARNGAMRLTSMRDSLGNIDWIKKILGDVPVDLPTKAQALVDAINKLGGINIDTGKIQQLGSSLIANFVNGIKNGLGNVTSVGSEMQGALWRAIEGKMGDMQNQGAAMAGRFSTGLKTKNNEIAQAGRDMQGALWRAIEAKMQDEYYQGAAMADKFASGLRSKNGEFYGVGQNATQGFVNGANSLNVYSVGGGIASRFLQGLKDKGKQGSPWKTTFQSGVWAGEGLANGILKSEDGVIKAAETIAGSVMDVMSLDSMGTMNVTPNMAELNSNVHSLSSTIDMNNVDRPNEVAIYGNISINAGDKNSSSILEELARATILSDKGMAAAV